MRHAAIPVLALFLLPAPQADATCGGGGGGGKGGAMPQLGQSQPQAEVYLVPWKIFPPGQAPAAHAGLTVHWLPASADEARKSRLQVSRLLTLMSAKCVAMALVTPDNQALIDKLAPGQPLGLVVLTDGTGKELARIKPGSKGLDVSDVERAVDKAMDAKEDTAKAQLKEAKAKLEAGDREGAIALYKGVAELKCLFPGKAKDAVKALEKLGVPLAPPAAPAAPAAPAVSLEAAPEPDLRPATSFEMNRLMRAGLVAEQKGRYLAAKALYARAHGLDPGDPVPLRYLGELERHHTGEWEAARAHFQALLAMDADPIGRAVALHGLGKMTIHDGRYEEGLALFQRSLEAYPLALTYRNLAVYWHEWDRAKSEAYARQALALEPNDPYTLIFTATYLAEAGKGPEALAIARQHRGLLSASYNLAAIHALLGRKGEALALLQRHFNRYERFEAVRTKEKFEASVDVVFASLKTDPRFKKLTAGGAS